MAYVSQKLKNKIAAALKPVIPTGCQGGQMRTWKETCIIARWLREKTELDAQDIARKLDIPIQWALGLFGLPVPVDPSLPPFDTPVLYNGILGKIHHAFRSGIAPSGILVGIYRYGPRGNYIGYVDSSQIDRRT